MRSLSAPQLAARLETDETRLVDVREPWEFDICHIPNSINIPMGEIPQRIDDFDEDIDTVIICHHGVRSRHVIQFLEQQAVGSLINLDGGVDAWARSVDPDMPVY